MLECGSCGTPNPPQARFCLACGAALASAAGDEVRKTVTIVFCDVAGSTAFGERMDPESVRRAMGRYFERMRTIIERHGGTVEKFIGDAVMAVFGIPTLREDDAVRAVRAANEMRASADELNDELQRELGDGFRTRIGVNTGEVIAGEVIAGEASPGQVFVTGDTVNVAARFEQAAPPGDVLIGESTYRLVRDAVHVEPVEPLELKGKSERMPAYRLVSVTAGASGIDRRLDLPMVGRHDELAVLEREYAAAVSRSACHLVTLMGEAGVGKSRLVLEFLSRRRGEAIVLRGRCLPYGDGVTFWPIVEVVRSACGIGELDHRDTALAKLTSVVVDRAQGERVAAGIAGLMGLGGSALGPEEIFWAIRRFLEGLGRDRPLIVVLDDIQWGEPTFLDLVEYLVDFSSGHPWLFVCLARTDLLESRPAWGAGRPNATSLTLEPLAPQESERLMRDMLGSAGLDHAVAARIAESAGGNPLFAQEMLRMLIEDGLLVRANGDWEAAGELASISIPPTIQALLAARLERLAQDERSVAQRASVVGKVFQWTAVAALSPEPERTVVGRNLQTLVRKELIRPDTVSFAGEDAFRFSHLLIRDAAYASTPKRQRAELHRRFAAWLEARSDEGAIEYDEICGYHLEQAYRYAVELGTPGEDDLATGHRAAELLARSGMRARARGDVNAAVRLLERAISLPVEESSRAEWQLGLLLALRQAGELERAWAALRELEASSERNGDRRIRAHARVQRLLWEGASLDEQERDGRELVEEFTALGDDAGLAKAWSVLSFAEEDRGADVPVEAYQRTIEHARRAGEITLADMAAANLCNAHSAGPTPVPEAIDLCEAALREAEGAPFLVSGILRALGCLFAMADRLPEARDVTRRAESLLTELGQRRFAIAAPQVLAEVQVMTGGFAAAEQTLRPGLDALVAMGDTYYTGEYATFLARAMIGLGELDEAGRLLEVARPFMGEAPLLRSELDLVHGLLESYRGDVVGAESLMRAAIEVADQTQALPWRGSARLALGEMLFNAGRRADALVTLEEARAIFEQKGHLLGLRRVAEIIATG